MGDVERDDGHSYSSKERTDGITAPWQSAKEIISIEDELLIIDHVLGRCDEVTAQRVERRLETDSHFAAVHEIIAKALAPLDNYIVPEPDSGLVGRTLATVRSARQMGDSHTSRIDRPGIPRRTFPTKWIVGIAAVLIIGLVVPAGILVPLFRHAKRLSLISRCADNAWAIGTALIHYANGSDGKFPGIAARVDSWLCLKGGNCLSNSKSLYLLVKTGCASPEVFQCPAAGGESFVPAVGMTDFPSPRCINYSYQYSLNSPLSCDLPGIESLAGQMAILADASPLVRGGTIRIDSAQHGVSPNHSDGQNVLYLDGHVDWTTDCHAGVARDNIWLAKGINEYTGKEKPACITDSFLLPHPGW